MEFPYKVIVCYIINGNGEVLLQLKRNGFGKGKWNGPGGKIRPGEKPEEAARREVREETTLIAKNLEHIGEIEFIFTEKLEWNNYMHIFLCREYDGEPCDTGEGELKWFSLDNLPFDKMWDDDKFWLSDALNGSKIYKRFFFDGQGKVIRQEDKDTQHET